MLSQDSEQDEREQIQDDIQRLELILREGDNYEETDDENVHTSRHYVPDYAGDADAKPGPSGIGTYEEDQDIDEDIEQPGTASGVAQLQMVGEDGEIVINPETCLALNRAYQEILLDLLRKIEISLQENRSKQVAMEEDLSVKTTRKNISSSEPQSLIKPLTAFRVPFFKDVDGRHAPQNEDVKLKKSLGEIRQDQLFPVVWFWSQRETLVEAVRRDAQEKLIRPLMNKKEVEAEKHMAADKNRKTIIKKEIETTLDDIDRQIEDIRSYTLDKLMTEVKSDDIDWMKISTMDFLGKHGSEDCKKFWVNVLQPDINKDKWVPEERDLLHELAIKHNMRNWDVIAKELGTNRSAYQCLQYYQQNLNENFTLRPWTEEEDSLLKEVVENCRVGTRVSWNQVCYFIEGRNWKQCQRRWAQVDPATKRGRWSQEEDFKLLSAVHLHGTSNWQLIHEMVQGRSAYQCRDRYNNCLDPNLKPPSTWTYEEDKQLLKLTTKYTNEEDGSISWTKVAAELEGRTDNMVLIRYKRLKSWKARSDWLDTQNDDTKAYLGTIYNKDGEDVKPSVEDINVNVPAGTFASGVQRDDYLKQIRDKQEGDIVVPRPPLSYKYSSRNMENVWQRKLQLKKIVEHHIQKNLNKSATVQDKMLIPSKSAQEFVPFQKLSKNQITKMNNLFKNKDPCTVKVSDMLAITNNFKNPRIAAVEKRKIRFSKDHRIERKMADIFQMKNYMSMITRSGAGRPKKFHIFDPYGKPPSKEVPENVVQLTSLSTTLMLSALEVNGHKALQNAQRKPEKKMSESEKENFTMLKKLFPPIPASMRVPPASNIQLKTGQGQQVISVGKTQPAPATKGKSSSKTGATAVDKLQGLRVSVTKNPSHLPGVPGSVKTLSFAKPKTVQGTVTKTLPSTMVTTVPASSLTACVRNNQGNAAQLLGTSKTPGNATRLSGTSTNAGNTVQLPGTSSNQGTAQPPRVVVVQKQGAQNPNKIPLLPPGVKNLEAFAGLVVQFQLLTASAGTLYNEKYYTNRTRHNRASLISPLTKEEKEDESYVKNVLNSFKNRSSAAVMRGAKHVNKSQFTKTSETSSLRDFLSDVRGTPEYQLLQKRFEGLFTWPALLSTAKVSCENEKPSNSLISGKKARAEQRRKSIEQRGDMPEPDIDLTDLLDAGEAGFATKMKKALGKQEYKKRRYACSNGKFFYRNKLINKEHRQNMVRKRMVARRLNKELREQGISVNDMKSKARPLKKRLHPTRQSSRLAEKMSAPQPELPPEAAASQKTQNIRAKKRKRNMNVVIKEEKIDETENIGVALEERLVGDRTQSDGVLEGTADAYTDTAMEQTPFQSENGVSNNSLGPTAGKRVKTTEKSDISMNSVNKSTGDNQTSVGNVAPTQQNLVNIVGLNLPSSSSVTGSEPSNTRGTGLQASTSMGPFTLFPGMVNPSAQGGGSVQSTPVATGVNASIATPVATGVNASIATGLPLATGSPIVTGSPSNIIAHPGLEGHVVFAIPVDQLTQSALQYAPGTSNQNGVFPVTLFLNANTLPISSPVRTNQPSGQTPADSESANQTAESGSGSQAAGSVVANQRSENSTANQTPGTTAQSNGAAK